MKKNSFLIHNDWIPLFQNFEPTQAGLLIQAICAYQENRELPEKESIIFAPFMMIKAAMDADLEKYQKECERRAENVKRRWNKENIQVNTSVYKCMEENTKNTDASQSYSLSQSLSLSGKDNRGVGEEEKPDEHEEEVQEIVDYLNEKSGKKFRSKTENTKKAIHGRLKDGYSVDDFKKVIDTKVAEWQGTDWEKYLTPDTLFRPSNFEKYLNQRAPTKERSFDDLLEDWKNDTG